MRLLISGLILFVLPLILTAVVTFAAHAEWRLHACIATFFMSSIVAVSLASEYFHGRIRGATSLVVSIGNGLRAFGWWVVAMGIIGGSVAGLYAAS